MQWRNQHEQQNMEALDVAFEIALGMVTPFLCTVEPPKNMAVNPR